MQGPPLPLEALVEGAGQCSQVHPGWYLQSAIDVDSHGFGVPVHEEIHVQPDCCPHGPLCMNVSQAACMPRHAWLLFKAQPCCCVHIATGSWRQGVGAPVHWNWMLLQAQPFC